MKTITEKADILIEAMPYIQEFRGATVVIKFGGSAMENQGSFTGILSDTAFMECVGLKPIIVHGGGTAISRRMKLSGIQPKFIKGLRVTDKESIRLAEEALNDEVNPAIVKTLIGFGAAASGIEGPSVLRAEKYELQEKGVRQDLGFVGMAAGVDTGPITACLDSGKIPVITPLGRDRDGQIYNINADDAAAAVAQALRARKLVFLSDVPGLLKDPADPESVISHLRRGDVDALIKAGIIDGGMMPKVSGAMKALEAGVRKIHIIDGRLAHSLLLEIFTKTGIGTEIVYDD